VVGSIKIVATPSGVKVEGEGYSGQTCVLDVGKMLAAMNISPGEAEPKPEFYLQGPEINQNRYQTGASTQ
jgi:hypothetical protein